MIDSTVLVAEDHPMYRDAIVTLLTELVSNPDQIVSAGEYQTGYDLALSIPDLSLIILDLKLPGVQGLEGLQNFRETFPLCPIIVISMLEMGGNVRNVMDMGANGFISKSTSKDAMLQGIKDVILGGIIVLTDEPPSEIKLTSRQVDVLRLLSEGLSNKLIAKELSISDSTVRDYLSEIMQLLDVENRTLAVLEAKKQGLILD